MLPGMQNGTTTMIWDSVLLFVSRFIASVVADTALQKEESPNKVNEWRFTRTHSSWSSTADDSVAFFRCWIVKQKRLVWDSNISK